MILRAFVVGGVLLLASCGSKAPATDECSDLAVKLRSTKPAAAQPMVDKVLPSIVRSCLEDAWPPEAMECFSKAPATAAALGACDRLLPKRVQDAITARQSAVK